MELKVDDEHYCSVTDFYSTQINKLEQDIETFKGICDSVFANNNYGTYLQEILQEMYINFYDAAVGQLRTLISLTATAVTDFIEDVERDDKL